MCSSCFDCFSSLPFYQGFLYSNSSHFPTNSPLSITLVGIYVSSFSERRLSFIFGFGVCVHTLRQACLIHPILLEIRAGPWEKLVAYDRSIFFNIFQSVVSLIQMILLWQTTLRQHCAENIFTWRHCNLKISCKKGNWIK